MFNINLDIYKVILNIYSERGFIMVKFYLFEEEEMKSRWEKCQVEMEKDGIDVLILSKPSNLFYMTGYRTQLWDDDFRAIIAVLPRGGAPCLVVPGLEGPAAEKESWFPSVRRWGSGKTEAIDAPELVKRVFEERKLLNATIGMELGDSQKLGMNHDVFEDIKASLPNCKFKSCGALMWRLRRIKSTREIEFMRKACQISDKGFTKLTEVIKEGMTERDIRRIMGRTFLDEGSDLDGGSYVAVSSGPDRSDMSNPWPCDRKLEKGNQVLLDFGAQYNFYASDLSREIYIAPIHDRQKELAEKALIIHDVCLKAAKPGNLVEDIDLAASAEMKRLGVEHLAFHRSGHSIGINVQEIPSIGAPEKTILEPGMCFAVEPGLYDYAYGGFRIEDDIVITEDGFEYLTNCERGIIVR